MKTRKLPTPGTGRIVIDQRAKDIWSSIENEEKGIDKRNWICLCYKSRKELVLSGSGEKGIEEAGSVFRDDTISFCVVLGCQKRGKNHLEKVRLLYLWIPDTIDPLKKARAIYDVGEVVNALDMKYFCLLGGKKKREVTRAKVITQITDIRGGATANPGRYFFDENVFRLREQIFQKNKEASKGGEGLQQEFKRKEAHVLRELLSTERHYVKCMNILHDRFIDPLKTHGHTKQHSFLMSMVFTIIRVNTEYYDNLLKLYIGQNVSDKDFPKVLAAVDESHFTKQRISDIVDISFECFKTFKFYGPYVSHYSKMLTSLSNLLHEDKKLRSYFRLVENDLKKSGERNIDYSSFLIMPIQRIPRYQLMFKELLKYTPQGDQNYDKIRQTLEEVKKIAKVVNENKENLIKVLKTIQLSKDFNKPELMSFKMAKFRSVEIMNRKKMGKSTKGTDTKLGEVFVFDKVLIICEMTKKKRRKGEGRSSTQIFMSGETGDVGDEFKLKIYCEIELGNKNVRCYRHPQLHDVCDVEDETKKISMKLDNGDLCEELVSIIQKQLSKFNSHKAMSSLYATRVLYKSWLKLRSPGEFEKRYPHVICADMKMKVYEKEVFNASNMIRSFSLIGAQYGFTSKEIVVSDEGSDLSYLEKGSGGGGIFNSKSSGSGSFVQSYALFEDTSKKKEEDKFWFYLIFKIAVDEQHGSKKKKKKKKKSCDNNNDDPQQQQQQQTVERKVYFRAEDRKSLDVWLGVFDMIGCCRRIDEAKMEDVFGEEEVEGEEEEYIVPEEVNYHHQEEEEREEEASQSPVAVVPKVLPRVRMKPVVESQIHHHHLQKQQPLHHHHHHPRKPAHKSPPPHIARKFVKENQPVSASLPMIPRRQFRNNSRINNNPNPPVRPDHQMRGPVRPVRPKRGRGPIVPRRNVDQQQQHGGGGGGGGVPTPPVRPARRGKPGVNPRGRTNNNNRRGNHGRMYNTFDY